LLARLRSHNGSAEQPSSEARLPRDLPTPSEIVPTDDLELFQLTVQGHFSDQRCRGMTVEEAHILHASCVGADLRRIRLADVMVEGADFSGADMEEASFSRVEFSDCRMSGALIPQAKLQDVSFTQCKLDGANFRMSEADRILFDHVNLRCVHRTGCSRSSCPGDRTFVYGGKPGRNTDRSHPLRRQARAD
jgi:hypothetical protein